MSVEALLGTAESFSPFFSKIRPYPGQVCQLHFNKILTVRTSHLRKVEAARNIICFLSESKLVQVNDGADSSLRQDRYSIRTAPQWLGPLLEDLVLSHQQLSIECNSATDNPLCNSRRNLLAWGEFPSKGCHLVDGKGKASNSGH